MSDTPTGSDFAVIAGGGTLSHALKTDGSIVSWGEDLYGRIRNTPGGNDFIDVAAGSNYQSMALRADGSIVSWGCDSYGDIIGLISNTPTSKDFVDIAATATASLALKQDGSIVAWGGADRYGVISTAPAGKDFIAIAAGNSHGLALRADGSIIAWGRDDYGQVSTTPTGRDFVAIAAGQHHSLALKSDGSIVSWGRDEDGVPLVRNTPTGNDLIAVAAGGFHSLALKADGSIVAWGYDDVGQVSTTPTGNNFVAISGGVWHSLALAVEVTNSPPVADAGGPYTGEEGSEVTFDGTGSSDPDGDSLTYAWSFGDGDSGAGATVSHIYADDGVYTVSLTVTDSGGATSTQDTTATIANVAPTVGPIAGLADPVELGSGDVCATAEFVDMGEADTHTAQWDWGDGTIDPGTVDEAYGFGSVTDRHAYTQAGIYTITLTVTDDDGDSGGSQFQYVVVYDPSGGFVTGGGWIDSPAGAYKPDPALAGKANFGFVSKYKKGASTPTGQTEFVFQAGDLNFHSSSYDWLVVTGSHFARFKGSGTINGSGCYKFMLWAGDDPDTFRIRIWTEDASGLETDVYDNGMDQSIGGGSIVIHTN